MTTRNRRILTLLAAYVALAGVVFQIAALDHWTPTAIEGVRGVEHTDFHATHCHGGAASCADGGSAPFWANSALLTVPLPPPSRPAFAASSEAVPPEAPIEDVLHPPRAV
jgi:hypothetical protein